MTLYVNGYVSYYHTGWNMAINKKLLQNNYFVFIFVAQVLIDVVVMIVVSNKFCKEK